MRQAPVEKRVYEVSWGSLWRILIFILLVSVLYLGRQIILGLFLAIVISSGLEGLVNLLQRTGLPRTISVIFVFLIIVLLGVLLVYSVAPLVIIELNTLFSGGAGGGGSTLATLFSPQTSQSISSFISKFSSQFFAGNSSPLSFFSNAIGSFGLAIAVILCSFYLTLSKDGVERFIKVAIPLDYEPIALDIYQRSRRLIGSWLRVQLLLSLIMGFIVWIGLIVLHVKYAFLIAFLAAIFELVPFVGPFLSGAVAVLAALSTSTTLAIYTLIFFIIAQQIESNVLVPLLNRQMTGLHPVIVIIALLIGATVGGFIGIIIAVPVAAVFQEVVEEWSIKKRATMEAA